MMLIIYMLMFSICFSYNVGDQVSVGHQNQEFDICYPSAMDNTVSLGDYNGNTNGGDYHILVIDMSATWCGPCQSLIPLFDQLTQNYSNNEYVDFFVALSDLNQPYSCAQWGNMGTSGVPKIIDDTGYPLFNMFGSGGFPSMVLIDHEMKVHYKESGYYSTFVSEMTEKIDEMLFNMENTLILYNEMFLTTNEDSDDGDGLLNPGESFDIDFIITNNSFDLDAINVTAAIENDGDIIFNLNSISFGNIDLGASSAYSLSGSVNEDVYVGSHDFNLVITADYIDLNGNSSEYTTTYPFTIDITLNQLGFPFDTNSEVKPSPAVVDFTGDGNNEVIFGDNNGLIHMVDENGLVVESDLFPFDTGNQVWGSPAAGYIDSDTNMDIVITSKSKHLYVLDQDGVKLDYYANQYLIGTPALGNLDNDDDLEIVFGSYSSPAKLYAVNIDGSDVPGFPVEIDEKMQKGVALFDFNNNGKDDIVLGTEDDNIYLVYDDGTIATGFPYLTENKVRSAPTILVQGDEPVILVGSNDDYFYAINSDGSLKFSYESDDKIETSPTVLETSSGLLIFFGTNNGTIYALDTFGNIQDGFPLIDENSADISGSVMFDDLDNDGLAEIIYGDGSGALMALSPMDNTYSSFEEYNNFPISNTFAYASSVNIQDIDMDGDLEIFGGTTGDVVMYDIKEESMNTNYWNIYRGNYHRTGVYITENQCIAGDINADSIINILDIVRLVNIVIDPSDITSDEECAADLNSDGVINILDIVTLVNIVIDESN